MRILILGGDGYLGWPTAMRFSARGHEVFIVDNFSRRRWHHEHSTDSLTPISSLGERIEAWREVTGRNIQAMIGNIDDGEFLDQVVADVMPEAVVHYGEQPRAPYSMISRRHAVNTQQTNVIGTLNLLFSLRDRVPDCHLVKLGTMGEYGTPNIDIEEGFIEIEHKGRKDTLPYPSCRARSTTSPRSTTPTTSTSPAGSGACARPTSTRASCTGSRRTRPCWTSACTRASTTTRSSAPR